MLFFVFSCSEDWQALVLYRQVSGPTFWALGATNFSSLRSFHKTMFSDSLTVWFS